MSARPDKIAAWGAADAKANAARLVAGLRTSGDPGAIVRSIEPYDLLIVWRIADDEQRSEILRLADKAQVDLLVDLICWRHGSDVPDLDALIDLVAPLASSGIEGADYVLETMEPELRTLLLRRNARFHLIEDYDTDIPAAAGSELVICPAGRYAVEFPEPQMVTDVERDLWEALFSRPFAAYQIEMECVIHELQSELEETALRWRNGRLADLGFATRQESMALLAPLTAKEARNLIELTAMHNLSSPLDIAMPVLYRQSLRGRDFLDQVLDLMLGSDRSELQERAARLGPEISAMVSLYLTATDVDISDPDSVTKGSIWARDLLALGLQEISGGDLNEGVKWLARGLPGVVLKVGLGLLYPLRARACKLLSDKRLAIGREKGAVFEPFYRVALECLSRDIPARWPVLEKGRDLALDLPDPLFGELEAFSSREQIDFAEALLDEAEELPVVLFQILGASTPLVRGSVASALVMTSLANAAYGRELRPLPLTFEEAAAFGEKALSLPAETLLGNALDLFPVAPGIDGSWTPKDHPRRRLLVKLVLSGLARLGADDSRRVLLTGDGS